MSRYIDADAFLKEYCEPYPHVYKAMSRAMADTPSIDIVRCGECRHWERLNYDAPKEGWCDDQMPYSDGRWVDADDFCSYGERSSE